MAKQDLPNPAEHVEALTLAASLLYNRLQDQLPYMSEADALKLNLATDMEHVSPEVRDLLGRAVVDVMSQVESIAESVADAVLNREPEPAGEDG